MADLKRKLDTVFSQYIRLRDADGYGYIHCISCGKIVFWKEADNGHFINRKHMSLRFSETNCNAQCRACNRFDEGNMTGYNLGLIKKYGHQTIDLLIVAKNQLNKISDAEYKMLIKYYQDKVKLLLKEKNL